MEARPLLAADNVSFSYGDVPIVEGVSLRIEPGEFVALVGPNGAGKSTLLRLLLGLLKPSSGSVELFGVAPEDFRERWRLGYVPQRPSLSSQMPVTSHEIVSTGRLSKRGWWKPARRHDRDETAHAIESVGLGEMERSPVAELSGGQQQRVFIARAFSAEPDLLVLDEPTAGVDADSQRKFRDSLVHLMEDHGAAVLLVSHELGAVAEDLDRILVLKKTIQFDGTPADLASGGVSLGVHHDDLPLWLEGLH